MKTTMKAAAMAALLAVGVAGVTSYAAEAPKPAPADKPMTMPADKPMVGDTSGKHSMSGEVTRVDTKDGWLHFKTADGTLIVHFPPSELQGVKKGDRMTLHLGLKQVAGAPKK